MECINEIKPYPRIIITEFLDDKVVLHRRVGEHEDEVVLLLQCQHQCRCSFISGGGSLLRVKPCALCRPETLERGEEDTCQPVEVGPCPCSYATGEGITFPRLILAPLLHRRAEEAAPGLVVVAALARRIAAAAAEPPSTTPSATRTRHRYTRRLQPAMGKLDPSKGPGEPARLSVVIYSDTLHERERNKKLGRLRSLKGKKRQKFRERYISNNTKYQDAARELLTPKVGYGLDSELRRAGVHVRTVPDKPQAADQALKRQVKHAIACGVDWVVLVSDDSDFTDTVRNARAAALRMVVVGDGCRALGKVADIWLPWDSVQNGEVDEEMMRSGKVPEFRYEEDDEQDDDEFIVDWDTNELDDVVDDIVTSRTKVFGSTTMSAFAEEDIVDGILGLRHKEDDMLWSSDDEDEDGYL
ncbi:unnamed protein product [Triticum turgidum subsp. durum]|uniref:NYN domain-containing protein n=1 Tax=Triticum turgidum subsp. durum TaxID=4567 RepID=A0A9R0Z3Q8_TRITD|nr:unnamed protein product [Triticum turgidum subsp. durum]